jgi:molybdopterin-guanine dinucleotide biosynthesis protein A
MARPTVDTLGIVVAGGASRRMRLPEGASKATLLLGGRTLLEHVCRAVRPEVARLVVVAGPDQTLPALPEIDHVLRDSHPGAGPLAGIADALREAGPAPAIALVTSCDVPLLQRDLVRLLIDRAARDGVVWAVPVINSHPQVLVSAMQTAILPEIEAFLGTGRRDLRGLFTHLAQAGRVATIAAADTHAVDPLGVSFADADTPEDLDVLAAILPSLPTSRH